MNTSVLSPSGKFKQLRHFAVVAALALSAVGCAELPGRVVAPRVSQTAQPLARLTLATPDVEHDLLAQLLAGELALAGNDLKSAAAHYDHAMALSDDPKVAERAATLAIAVHDEPAAARAVTRWQALGAAPAALAQARAQLALARGDTAGARRELESLLGSGDPNAWRQFGRVLFDARDPAQAAQLLQALASPRKLPADPQVWLAMSELGDKLGRQKWALELANAAVARFRNAETYAFAARLTMQNGDREGALTLLRQALAKTPANTPSNTRLRLAYASVLSKGGDYAGAAKLLDSGRQDSDTYEFRAALAAQMHDRKTMARLYREVQQAPPALRERSAFLLGQLAEMQDLPDAALGWYDQVGDSDQHAFDADLRSAVILHGQNKRSEAHELLEQLETAYLDQPGPLRRAWEADAELYMREGNHAKAASAFSHALQVVPNDPGLLYGRGLAYAEAGQTDQAVADLRQLLRLKPGDVDASNALGFTLADANRDLSEAQKLIEAARAAKPNDPAIADSWGWLQYRLGHLDQAAQILRGAWAAHNDADIGVHLGEVLWKQGHRADAQRVFDEVRRVQPQNVALRETLQRLKP